MSESYRWEKFNLVYGPWHRLRRIVNGVRADMLVPGWKADAVVQPDMDGERWYWHVLMQRKGEKGRTAFGRVAELAEAKLAAEEALEALQFGGGAAVDPGGGGANSTAPAAAPPADQGEGPIGTD